MGGHGGLNILPQKRWNVYNFDNREKVRKDEESAAKEEQLKREQSRRRDSEIRLQQLRVARGLPPGAPAEPSSEPPATSNSAPESAAERKGDANHVNLFEGIKIFDPIFAEEKKERKRGRGEEEGEKKRKRKKEEEVRAVGPEDEVYRLGYGVAGKGVKAPWYAVRREVEVEERKEEGRGSGREEKREKKTVAELREERLRREKAEKERERALVRKNGGNVGRGGSVGQSYGRDRERRQWR